MSIMLHQDKHSSDIYLSLIFLILGAVALLAALMRLRLTLSMLRVELRGHTAEPTVWLVTLPMARPPSGASCHKY